MNNAEAEDRLLRQAIIQKILNLLVDYVDTKPLNERSYAPGIYLNAKNLPDFFQERSSDKEDYALKGIGLLTRTVCRDGFYLVFDFNCRD